MITVCALPVVGRKFPPVATGLKYWCTLGDAVAAPTTPVPATMTSAHPQRRARWAVRVGCHDIDMRSPPENGTGLRRRRLGFSLGRRFDAIGTDSFRQGRFV